MLQSLRERTQGIIAGAIVILICITFALWGIQYYTHGSGNYDAVAKVNGVEIKQADLHATYERARMQMLNQSQGKFILDQEAGKKFKQQVLDKLIQDQILLQKTKDLNLSIGINQLKSVIMHMPIFSTNGQFSPERFQQVLAGMLYSEDAFFKEITQMMLFTQLNLGIADSNFALLNEVSMALSLQKQKRAIGYFMIPENHFISQVKITDQDILDYYQKHNAEYMTPEAVSIEYLSLSTDQLTKKLASNTPVADIKKFYQDNIASYSQSKEAKTGAKSISKPLAFAAVRDRVQKDFLHHKVTQLFSEQNDKLTDLTYTNSDSLAPAAKELGLQIQSTGLFTKEGGKTGLIADKKIIKAAFSDAVLNQGYNSSVIEMSPGNILVLRVKQHLASKTRDLKEVRPLIENKLRTVAVHKMAKDLADSIEKDLTNKVAPNDLAKHYHLVWQTTGSLDRKDNKLPTELVKAAFGLSKVGSVATIDLNKGGFAILQLNKIFVTDTKNITSQQRIELQNSLEKQFGVDEFSMLRSAWEKNAKIEKFEANKNNEE